MQLTRHEDKKKLPNCTILISLLVDFATSCNFNITQKISSKQQQTIDNNHISSPRVTFNLLIYLSLASRIFYHLIIFLFLSSNLATKFYHNTHVHKQHKNLQRIIHYVSSTSYHM